MPSRRSPVPIVRARTSKSSTTSTLMTCLVILRVLPRPGHVTWADTCQVAGVSPVSAADTGLTPAAA